MKNMLFFNNKNSMARFINLFLICYVLIFCTGCPIETNVPISEKKNIFDERILGYWLNFDKTGIIYFYKLDNGELGMAGYSDNRKQEEIEKSLYKVLNSTVESNNLFTARIKNHYFISIHSTEETKDKFYTAQYNFMDGNTLFINSLNSNKIVSNDMSELKFSNSLFFRNHLEFLFDNFAINQIFSEDEISKYNFNDSKFTKIQKKDISKYFSVQVEVK